MEEPLPQDHNNREKNAGGQEDKREGGKEGAMGCVSSRPRSRRAGSGAPAPDAWDGRVRLPAAWTVEPAITTEQLTRLRNEFWETRVEGRAEMWQALRFAAEADSVRFLARDFLRFAACRDGCMLACMHACMEGREEGRKEGTDRRTDDLLARALCRRCDRMN